MAWSNVKEKNNNNGGERKKATYVTLKEGQTVLRVVDEEPVSRWTHWIPQANAGKGLGVTCAGKGCIICSEIAIAKKKKEKAKYSSSKSHAINTINRETNQIEILDKGNKVFQGLLDIMETMGDLRNYDVIIKKSGSGLGNVNYSVLPKFPPVALKPEELAMERFNLEDLSKPFTNEELQMFMNGCTIEQVVETRKNNEVVNETEAEAEVAPTTDPTVGGMVNPNISIDFTQGA